MRSIITKSYLFLLLVLAVVCSNTSLSAQQASSIFDLLSTHPSAGLEEARKINLRLPMDSIYAKTKKEQDATLSFVDDTGREFRRPLQVGVRGKFRRRTCTFPPLKLNFSKKQLQADGLAPHDKLKLVTPCFEDENGQLLILKEYLAYKIYEQLNPASFRTQLVEITYRDVHHQYPDQTVFAFILEDNGELAERLGGVKVKDKHGISPDRFDRQSEITQALFSFMIGNHDWSLAMARNLKMVELSGGEIIPVPYDFDFSNMVDAPYRSLNSSIGQTQFQQRIYLGLYCADEMLEEAFLHFQEKRKSINKMIRGFSIMPIEERVEIVNYLGSFYYEFRRLQKDQTKAKLAGTDLYQLIRAEQFDLLPAGANPAHYGISK